MTTEPKHTPYDLAYEIVPYDEEERQLGAHEWTGIYIGPSDDEGGIWHTIFEGGFTHGAKDGDPEADAKRWVACWNACAGIPTEQLQAGCVALMSDTQLLEAADRLENATGCIQGFTHGERHWIRDLSAPRDQQVIWRGNSHTEMMRQIRFHNMKRALAPFQDKPE